MQKQHPEEDSSSTHTSKNQLRLLGYLMILIGPLMLAIVLTSGAGEVSIGGISLPPPLSTIAMCGLAVICFLIGIAFVWKKGS